MEQDQLNPMKMNKIDSPILSGTDGFVFLREYISSNPFECVVLVLDENTREHCLALFLKNFPAGFFPHVYVLPAGEQAKTLDATLGLLSYLLQLDAPVNSLLISLGGGAISDVCGFVASIYKRGIKVVHVPTSLIGMIDASYGGKTGINFQHVKNVFGTFYFPDLILLDHVFLNSLPSDHLRSGYGEMLKYALLIGGETTERILTVIREKSIPDNSIMDECLNYKKKLVLIDPFDKKERYFLNLGHTIGHALESAYQVLDIPVTHGWAVARGIYFALTISSELSGFPLETAARFHKIIQDHFPTGHLPPVQPESLLGFLKQDKKISGKNLRMVLLSDIGRPMLHNQISDELILKVLS